MSILLILLKWWKAVAAVVAGGVMLFLKWRLDANRTKLQHANEKVEYQRARITQQQAAVDSHTKLLQTQKDERRKLEERIRQKKREALRPWKK